MFYKLGMVLMISTWLFLVIWTVELTTTGRLISCHIETYLLFKELSKHRGVEREL